MTDTSMAPVEARVARLSTDDAKVAAAAIGVSDRLAELNVFRVLLHHPRLSQAISGLLGTLLFEGNELDPRLRELLILRIAWVTGSDYECRSIAMSAPNWLLLSNSTASLTASTTRFTSVLDCRKNRA